MHLAELAKPEPSLHLQSGRQDHKSTVPGEGALREQQLIVRAQSGDAEAFYMLIQPYLRFMQHLVRPILPHSADAEDVVQEAVITAFTKLKQLRSLRSFRSWLLQIAVNEARMRRRSFLRRRTECLSEITFADSNMTFENLIPVDDREMPFLEAANRQIRKHLLKALDGLPSMYREVFVLRDIRQLTVRQTAQILRLKPPTLQTRLRRARALLRNRLLALWESDRLGNTGSFVPA